MRLDIRPLLIVCLLLALALVAVGAKGQPLRDDPEAPRAGAALELSFGAAGHVSEGKTSLGFFVSIGGKLDVIIDRPKDPSPPKGTRAPLEDDVVQRWWEDDGEGAKRAPKKEPPPEPGPVADEPSPPEEPPAPKPRVIDGTLARGLVRSAIRVFREAGAADRLDSLATRSRASALLPEIRVRVGHDVDEGATVSPTEYDPTRVTSSGGSSLWVEGRATFRLDRLVFADDEVAIERMRADREKEERALADRILGLIEKWQAAERTMADPGIVDPEVRAKAEVARIATAAALDVLTDGWFSAHVDR